LAKDDSTTVLEELAKLVGSSQSDSLSFADSEARGVGKGLSDSHSISESLARVVTFERVFSDAASLDDTASASDDLATQSGINKNNVLGVTDSEAFNISKGGISDTPSLSEALALFSSLAVTDTSSITDALVYAFGFAASDTTSISESLAHSFGKSVSDSATITESVSILFVPGGGSILNTTILNTFVLNG